MKVVVRMFGAYADLMPERMLELEVAGDRIADLRVALGEVLAQRWPDFQAGLLRYSAFADEHTVLRDGEPLPADGRVAILPPVSGG
ncbi:MoaD/ThiS family protein [Stenotrophomonas rhizophila]|uniref:Molybdopterin synthase sulfur carrier subunit n=1 Tax=Stenotrophomonas rhizophila TaxID=216778 RepID=A0AAW5PGR4_9GAMM|nr:molybdopterin converting factor [Stenotrophomonas rhizophila]MCS4279211.1 molybdopterin synthase sulfur carrier subunit [Stenotrophomonas rhizophila]